MKNSIIYPIIGIIVLLSVAISAGNYLLSTQSLNRLAGVDEQKVLDAAWSMAQSNVQHEIDDMETLSRLLKDDMHIQEGIRHYASSGGDDSRLKEAMDNIFSVLDVDMLAIIDDKENVIYAANDPESGGDIDRVSGVAVALAGNVVTSTSKTEDGWSLLNAIPVEYEGRIFGALVVGESLDDEFASSIANISGADVSFASLDGTFASSLPQDQREILDPDLAFEILSQKRGLSASHPESKRIVSYKPAMIVDQVFVLIVGIDTEMFQQILEENQRTVFYATIIILSVALIIGVLLSRRLIGPLETLRKGVEDISAGHLDTKIKIGSKNEIGELASAFNQMTVELKKSRTELEEHSKELEEKVEGRTTELDTKVQELTKTKTAVLNMMEDMDEANTELIKIQEQLKKSLNELKVMDVKKDQFISIAAHELKTPLTSIHGFSQLLQNRKVANNFTKRNKYLKIMDHETKRLGNLVNDILDLSRIDLGTIKMNYVKVSVKDLMEDIKREMDMQIKEKGLKSEYDIPKDVPVISTDRERLTQVLINIIKNAVKYSEKGGIRVKVSKDKGYVRFSVRDTGIGIPKEGQEKIFERFYQIDSSYTRKAGGTGLGLSLCKEFVEMLGGKIWVESEEGKGSEFRFTVPVKRPMEERISETEKKARDQLKKSEAVKATVKKMALTER
jgi:signal transduction histidine kinase